MHTGLPERLYWRETATATYVEPAVLEPYPWLRCAFTTRHGGASGGSFNVSFDRGERSAVLANRQAAVQAMGLATSPLFTVRQVHGNQVWVVDEHIVQSGLAGAQGDALITNLPQVALGVLVADCLPIILYTLCTPVVAIVHAGRMGTYHRVVQQTLACMASRFAVENSQIHAILGPAIGRCCYRLDQQALQPFQEKFPDWESFFIPHGPGFWSMDLVAANVTQLQQAGVVPAHIDITSPCTVCHNTHFYSHRAEGQKAGRCMAIVGIQSLQGL